MNKIIARTLAVVMLAGGFIGSTAIAASANPPKRQQCYSFYSDGVFVKSTYFFLWQNQGVCAYSHYARYANGETRRLNDVIIGKPARLV